MFLQNILDIALFPEPEPVLCLTLPPVTLPFLFHSCQSRNSGSVMQNYVRAKSLSVSIVADVFFLAFFICKIPGNSMLFRIRAVLNEPLPVNSLLFLVPKTGFCGHVCFSNWKIFVVVFTNYYSFLSVCQDCLFQFAWINRFRVWCGRCRLFLCRFLFLSAEAEIRAHFRCTEFRVDTFLIVPLPVNLYSLFTLTHRFQFGFLTGDCIDSNVTIRFDTVSLSWHKSWRVRLSRAAYRFG